MIWKILSTSDINSKYQKQDLTLAKGEKQTPNSHQKASQLISAMKS